MKRGSKLVIAIIIALSSIIGYYFKNQTNPYTGETQHIGISAQEEIAIGLNSAPEMAQQFGGEYRDPKVQAMVDQVGKNILEHTVAGQSEYPFDFHVLADPETVNAFALPGGQVFITMGLLKLLETEDQLAGVLGHEMGHVIGRHSAEHMAKDELSQGLVNAAQVATADPNNPNGSAQIAAFVANMVNLKYGRADELESDKFGVKFLIQTGYNPNAMIEVMEILEKASGGKRPAEFMSSHPSPENRIEMIKQDIEEYKSEAGN